MAETRSRPTSWTVIDDDPRSVDDQIAVGNS
jgi:hypothetical protein